MMTCSIRTILLFLLLVVHVTSQHRREIADGLVNDQYLAIRRHGEDAVDQQREHREDPRTHDIDRTDQRRHNSRTHRKIAIDRERPDVRGSRSRKEGQRIHIRERPDTDTGKRFENADVRDLARMDQRVREQIMQHGRGMDPRRHNTRWVDPRTHTKHNVNQGTERVDPRLARRVDPRRHNTRWVEPRTHNKHNTNQETEQVDPRLARRVDPRRHNTRWVDPRRHNTRWADPRTHNKHNTNQETEQVDPRLARRDSRGHQPADTHRRQTQKMDAVVTRSETGDKSKVQIANEHGRRMDPNVHMNQRRTSRLNEERRREHQRIIAERRRVQVTGNVDPRVLTRLAADPTGIQDRRRAEPTGVNVERVGNPTEVRNREGVDTIGLNTRKRDDHTGINNRRRADPTGVNTRERADPIGIDTRRRHDPTGIADPSRIQLQRRVSSRLIQEVDDPRRSRIREGGVQRTDHRRHPVRTYTRGETVDLRRPRVSTDTRTTHDRELVDPKRAQMEVIDDSKTNERFDRRKPQARESVDMRGVQGNTRDDRRNVQNNRRVDRGRVDLRRVASRTGSRRVNTRDPTGVRATLRRSQQNADHTKTQVDIQPGQDRTIDLRRTIGDTHRRHNERTRIGQQHRRRHHPISHGNLATKPENTTTLTIEGPGRRYESFSGQSASVKWQEREKMVQAENKNIADPQTFSGGHTVDSANVDNNRTDPRTRTRVDSRTLTYHREQRERILRERENERQKLIQEREEQRRRILQERENRQRLENGPIETIADPRRRSSSRGVNSEGSTVENVGRTQSIDNRRVDTKDPRLERRRVHTNDNNDPRRRLVDPRRVQYFERTINPSNSNVESRTVDRNSRGIQQSARRGLQITDANKKKSITNGRIADVHDTRPHTQPQSVQGNQNGHPHIALSDGVIIGGPLGLYPAGVNASYISDSTIISRVYKKGSGRPIEKILVRSRPDTKRRSSVLDPTGIADSGRNIRRQDSVASVLDPTGVRNSGSSLRREVSAPNDRRHHRFIGPSSSASVSSSSHDRRGLSPRGAPNTAGGTIGRRIPPSRESSHPFRHGSLDNRRPIDQSPEQPIQGARGVIIGAVLE